MRRFLYRAVIFLALLCTGFTLSDLALTNYIQYHPYGGVNFWAYLMKDQIDADCIVLGSSRALNHIVPAILDSALSVRSYNLGMAGAHIDDVWARYQLYRLRNKAPSGARM